MLAECTPKAKARKSECDIVAFAHAEGRSATTLLSEVEQKSFGQFMTPPSIALAMAQRSIKDITSDVVRILEPAAGAGVLAAAVFQSLINRKNSPSRIEVTLCEMDARLMPVLRKLAERMRRVAIQRGVGLTVSIKEGDFLLSEIATVPKGRYDLIIANPPYFKLNKAAPQAVAHDYVVYGQPNIYGLFMASTVRLLAPDGKWCFITPRSWTNGSYFAAVRRHILSNIQIEAIHVFESRQAHFDEDEILQEAVITWGSSGSRSSSNIVVSTSHGGHDISEARARRFPSVKIIESDWDRTIILPLEDKDCSLATSETLESLGLKVSTGPVVAFRSEPHISEIRRKKTVPLLWMQHVSRMAISWPIDKKREHIAACNDTEWMLVPNSPMVILRRFSPKEDVRRVTAAGYAGDLKTARIGLENHLNYIYRPGGEMRPLEAIGMAAYLNSRQVDLYLRSIAGSTQVNARELRKLPMPTRQQLIEIGQLCSPGMALADIDFCVDSVLNPTDIAA